MIRTTAPCPGGRTVTYTSDDGTHSALTRPTAMGWAVDLAGDGMRASVAGTFRSEREAMDQARSRVKYYELEQRSPSR
jgi:hypothetical protein